MEVANRRWSDEEFLQKRTESLSWWPTGKEVEDLSESIEYRKHIPDEKVWTKKVAKAKKEGKVLLWGHVGHASVEETIDQIKLAEKEAAVDLHYVFPDTYTRKNMFAQAQRGIEESLKQGRSMLNGYPIVNHGLKKARLIVDSVNVPLIFATGDEETMLIAEFICAAGFNLPMGGLESDAKFAKHHPPDRRLWVAQYNAKLAAYYVERGAPVLADIVANLPGWDPPCMRITLGILATLMTAEQGVKDIDIMVGQTSHLVQDVAGLRVARKLLSEYMQRFGYNDVNLYFASYPWLGAWPRDPYQMAGLVAWSTAIGVLGGVNWISVKSLDEAIVTPTMEASAYSLKIAKQIVNTLGNQRLPDSEELKTEEEIIELEVKAILERVIELGDGDIVKGQVKAVESGVIDVAFSPWLRLMRKVLTVRDRSGAIRYLDHGNIPLPQKVIEYHRQKIAERETERGKKADIEMVIEDVTYLSRPIVKAR